MMLRICFHKVFKPKRNLLAANHLLGTRVLSSRALDNFTNIQSHHQDFIPKPSNTFVESLCSQVGLRIGRDIVFKESLEEVSKQWVDGGSLGMGESYMAGSWAEGPEASLAHVWGKMSQLPASQVKQLVATHLGPWGLAQRALGLCGDRIYQKQSVQVAKTLAHYNVGNDFFQSWLDKRMVYSCGYWYNNTDKYAHWKANPEEVLSAPLDQVRTALEEAQLAKLELVAQKAGVGKGDKVLDIGCGWGALCDHMQTQFGAQATGITISEPQADICGQKSVEALVQDYREHTMSNHYDAIVSVGMLEHVGLARLQEFFSGAVAENLKEGGTAVIQFIGGSIIGKSRQNEWIEKYIFPNGETPSLAEVLTTAEQSRLVIEDVQNFGPDYETTLLCWLRLFESMTDDELLETIRGTAANGTTEKMDLVVFRRM